MTRLPLGRARAQFADAVNRVAYGHERVVLQRRGKDVAALIPIEDLRLLERLVEDEEDRIDVAAARKVLARKGEKAIPYEEVRKDLGLAPATGGRRRAKRAG